MQQVEGIHVPRPEAGQIIEVCANPIPFLEHELFHQCPLQRVQTSQMTPGFDLAQETELVLEARDLFQLLLQHLLVVLLHLRLLFKLQILHGGLNQLYRS